MSTSPSVRALIAAAAAHERWSKTGDTAAATKPARDAFNARFERQVDPESRLEPTERARRAAHARKAYFKRLAAKSAAARAKKAS